MPQTAIAQNAKGQTVAVLQDCDLPTPAMWGLNKYQRLLLAHAAGVPCEMAADDSGRPVRALIQFWIAEDEGEVRIAVAKDIRHQTSQLAAI